MVVEFWLIVHFHFTPPLQPLFHSLDLGGVRIYNRGSIGCIFSCNIGNMSYVSRLSLALASVEALMVLPEKLASGPL